MKKKILLKGNILDIKPKLIYIFTKRQLLSVIISGFLSFVVFRLLNGVIDKNILLFIILIIDTPFVFIGFISPYKMNFEKYVLLIFKYMILTKTKRGYIDIKRKEKDDKFKKKKFKCRKYRNKKDI